MGIFDNLPLKNVVPIFVVTFLMIFVGFVLIEPSMYCEDSGSVIPECALTSDGTGSFILGIMIAGVLFLIDMALIYMTIGDFFLPDLASDQE